LPRVFAEASLEAVGGLQKSPEGEAPEYGGPEGVEDESC
jgi:hypothetical protein